MSKNRSAVVLAAGQGTRMNSSLVKVLHRVCGMPMVERIVRSAAAAGCEPVVVVVGHQADAVKGALAHLPGVAFATQAEQRGTGHAVQAAAEVMAGFTHGTALISTADVPLLRAETLGALARSRETSGAAVTVLSMLVDDPSWYGRVIRNADGVVERIVEARDCSAEEAEVREVNTGIYAVDSEQLWELLGDLSPDNDPGELYLTDIVAAARRQGLVADALVHGEASEVLGINDRNELARAEAALYARTARHWMTSGVTFRDPASIRVDPEVELTRDVVLEPGVELRGSTRVGEGTTIGTGCVITSAEIGARAEIRPYTVMTGTNEKRPSSTTDEDRVVVGSGARVGPFAHLRMRTVLGPDVHLGNFVEGKNTRLEEGAKANHLAYLGDGRIGSRANVGAGVIFCNYDGAHKHRTEIGEDAFIGSDCQLVAPVTVGDRAYVGSGSTVTQDVPDGALMVTRVRPRVIEGAGDRKHERTHAKRSKGKR